MVWPRTYNLQKLTKTLKVHGCQQYVSLSLGRRSRFSKEEEGKRIEAWNQGRHLHAPPAKEVDQHGTRNSTYNLSLLIHITNIIVPR